MHLLLEEGLLSANKMRINVQVSGFAVTRARAIKCPVVCYSSASFFEQGVTKKELTPGVSINQKLPSPNQSTPLSKHPTPSHFLPLPGKAIVESSPFHWASSTFDGAGSSRKWYFLSHSDGHAEFGSCGYPGPIDSRESGPRMIGTGWGRVSRSPLIVSLTRQEMQSLLV
jgi:hypothetical protein